jgi:hypothetical protein
MVLVFGLAALFGLQQLSLLVERAVGVPSSYLTFLLAYVALVCGALIAPRLRHRHRADGK